MSDRLVDAAKAYPPQTHEDYQIGIICALATEKAAVVAMLDETYPRLKKEKGDENEYTLGRIGIYNVVVACLPAGLMGNGPATIVANNILNGKAGNKDSLKGWVYFLWQSVFGEAAFEAYLYGTYNCK
jgi:hypothetical protein